MKKEKIIVSFTSWKKRIQYCSQTVDSMLNQTLKPTKIILNLSTDEFVNKEKDLPIDLVKKQNDVFEIYWVKENTKVYKKILPTLERFPKDIIISIDDDIDYPKNFIETQYKKFKSINCENPVTSGTYTWGNDRNTRGAKIYTHYGCFSLVKNDFFGPYLKDLYENVVLKYGIEKIPFSDPIFTYAALLNGKRYYYTEDLDMSFIRKNSKRDKENRLSETNTRQYKDKMYSEHKIIQEYILKKYGKTYDDITKGKIIVTFTTWTKRHNVVPKMLENLKKQTLKPDKIYCCLSSDEYGGENVPECIKKYVDEKYIEIRWVKENSYCHKRYDIFKQHCNDFVFIIDDDILYKPTYFEELYEVGKKNSDCVIVYSTTSCDYIGLNIKKKPAIIGRSHKNNFMGGTCMFPPNTLPFDFFGKEELRRKYVKKCDESWLKPLLIKHNIEVFAVHNWSETKYNIIDGTQDCAVWNENKQSIGNGMREKERNFFSAIKIHNTLNSCKNIWPNLNIDYIDKFMCTDVVCTTEEENTIVCAIKPESINERYSKIMQLRKDIANGKIIKVYVGDGKFVWKRIK